MLFRGTSTGTFSGCKQAGAPSPRELLAEWPTRRTGSPLDSGAPPAPRTTATTLRVGCVAPNLCTCAAASAVSLHREESAVPSTRPLGRRRYAPGEASERRQHRPAVAFQRGARRGLGAGRASALLAASAGVLANESAVRGAPPCLPLGARARSPRPSVCPERFSHGVSTGCPSPG